MSFIKKFCNKLRDLDFFAVNLSFTYASKEKYGSSIFGSMLTIIIIMLLIIKLVIAIKKLILKEDLETELEVLPGVNNQIALKSLELSICPWFIFTHQNSEYNKIFSVNFSLVNGKHENGHKMEGQLLQEFCLGTIPAPDNDSQILKSKGCFCTNFNETYYPNITNSQKMRSDQFLEIIITADFSTYTFDSKLMNEFKEIIIIFNKTYVNTSDYYNVFKSSEVVLSESIRNNSQNYIEMEVDNLQVDKINDILSFGLFEPKTYSSFNYSIYKKQNNFIHSHNGSGYIFLNIKHSNVILKYSIHSFNLDNFLAHFGGYFQVFYFLFNFASKFVNEYSLEKQIERKFSESHYLANSNKINQNFYVLENNGLNFEKTFQKDTEMKSFDKDRLHQKKISSNNINDAKQIYKNEGHLIRSRYLKNVFHNREYFKDIAEDFKDHLDYEAYYYLIKEIKLIEFLLLDSKSSELFKVLNSVPFNLGKFEKYMNEKQKSLEADGDYLCDNLLDIKLKDFKEFLKI